MTKPDEPGEFDRVPSETRFEGAMSNAVEACDQPKGQLRGARQTFR